MNPRTLLLELAARPMCGASLEEWVSLESRLKEHDLDIKLLDLLQHDRNVKAILEEAHIANQYRRG